MRTLSIPPTFSPSVESQRCVPADAPQSQARKGGGATQRVWQGLRGCLSRRGRIRASSAGAGPAGAAPQNFAARLGSPRPRPTRQTRACPCGGRGLGGWECAPAGCRRIGPLRRHVTSAPVRPVPPPVGPTPVLVVLLEVELGDESLQLLVTPHCLHKRQLHRRVVDIQLDDLAGRQVWVGRCGQAGMGQAGVARQDWGSGKAGLLWVWWAASPLCQGLWCKAGQGVRQDGGSCVPGRRRGAPGSRRGGPACG